MAYDVFQKSGKFIGFGVVEASCKALVMHPLKLYFFDNRGFPVYKLHSKPFEFLTVGNIHPFGGDVGTGHIHGLGGGILVVLNIAPNCTLLIGGSPNVDIRGSPFCNFHHFGRKANGNFSFPNQSLIACGEGGEDLGIGFNTFFGGGAAPKQQTEQQTEQQADRKHEGFTGERVTRKK